MVKKRTTPSYTEDEVREAILKLLYEKWKNPRGMETANAKISDIRSNLKKQGMGQQQVIRNLQYLMKTNWVEENVKTYSYNTGRFSIPRESKSYTITNHGIEYFEGRSKFENKQGTAGIRIENVSGVVTIGDNNYVRQEFGALFRSLDDLDNRIRLTEKLSDTEKVSYTTEVKAIQNQLSKADPDKDILRKSWGALKGIATIGTLVNVMDKVKTGIEQAIGISLQG